MDGIPAEMVAEPNDTQATATKINEEPDCTVPTVSKQTGTLGGGDDADFYLYPNGIDVCAGPKKPTLKHLTSLAGTRFCLFPQCAAPGFPELLLCEGSSTYTLLDGGVEGCCSLDADVPVHVECSTGSSTLTDFLVRVDQPGYDDCNDYGYELTYTQ